MNYLGHITPHDPRKDRIEADLTEFEDLVNFTLDKFDVDARFRIIYVFREWDYYFISNHIYQIYMAHELAWFDDFIEKEDPSYHKSFMDIENKAKEINKVEYGIEMSLSESLSGPDGLTITLIEYNGFNGLVMIECIEEKLPIFFEIHKMKEDGIEFVILIKERMLLRNREDKLKLVAHEAYHIVENVQNSPHEHDFVNRMASRIVDEYQMR